MRIRPALLAVAIAGAAPASAQTPVSLAGTYDGGQMEMAAMLQLSRDGRFAYGLVYGTLDEAGQGNWSLKDGTVLLTSDPVTPPRFIPGGQKAGSPRTLDIALEVPKGMSPQYFEAVVTLAGGGPQGGQFDGDGHLSLPVDPADPPVSVRILLPMFEIAGEVVKIDPARGYSFSFGFEPNDLGKADFRGTALTIDKGDLLLDRFGRTIRFRKVE